MMILLITAVLILCGNVFITEAEVIPTVQQTTHDLWLITPVSHISDGIVRSYDVSGGAFINDYDTDAMDTSVGDLESRISLMSLGEAYELIDMHVHHDDNFFFIDVSKQNHFTELPESHGVAKMSMIPSRSHSIFDGGVVVIALNYDVATNDSCNDDVPETTYRGYDVGLCAGSCNYEDATCVGSKAAPASQDWCDTCCTETGVTWYDDYTADMKSSPGVMTLVDSYQLIISSNI